MKEHQQEKRKKINKTWPIQELQSSSGGELALGMAEGIKGELAMVGTKTTAPDSTKRKARDYVYQRKWCKEKAVWKEKKE